MIGTSKRGRWRVGDPFWSILIHFANFDPVWHFAEAWSYGSLWCTSTTNTPNAWGDCRGSMMARSVWTQGHPNPQNGPFNVFNRENYDSHWLAVKFEHSFFPDKPVYVYRITVYSIFFQWIQWPIGCQVHAAHTLCSRNAKFLGRKLMEIPSHLCAGLSCKRLCPARITTAVVIQGWGVHRQQADGAIASILSIMFHRTFNRSSHVWSKFHSILFICLFIVFLVLLVPSTTPRSSSLGMSWKTFQAHLRSSLEALSCSKQIWPRAVILSSESQWMSMDVNGISGAETDLFDFYLPVHWGDIPSGSPLKNEAKTAVWAMRFEL